MNPHKIICIAAMLLAAAIIGLTGAYAYVSIVYSPSPPCVQGDAYCD